MSIQIFTEDHMKDPRSFQEDFSHENGNYYNHCYSCRNVFVGHKRRLICKLCIRAERIEQVRSKKHPGSVFFKVKGTQDNFILKLYPEHANKANDIEQALEQIFNKEKTS